MARCDGYTDIARRGFEIPAWMLDRALCSTMTLRPHPFVDVEALIELRDILDRILHSRRPDVIEDGHRLDSPKGGADAQATTQSQANGIVRSSSTDP